MTARAYVERDFARDGVAVYLGDSFDDARLFVGEPTNITFRALESTEMGIVREPTLRLPESMARALLDALAAHFGGVSEVQTLREDYLAERARVDKMVDYLTRGER